MGNFIDIGIKIEGLDKEYRDEITEINNAIPKALERLGSEMAISLKKHIQQDWHDVWKPSKYHRRTDNPSLGTPLGDDKNITIYVDRFTKTMSFLYLPTGEHQEGRFHNGWYLGGDGARRDTDELITAIQKGELAGNPPPRPFWNNFVEEQQNGEMLSTFIRELKNLLPYSISTGKGERIQLNGTSESMLPYGAVQRTFVNKDGNIDEELFG